jgi:hypothetical protein
MRYSSAIFLLLAFIAGSFYNNSKLLDSSEMPKVFASQTTGATSPTQIALFEHVSLYPGQKLSSNLIDIRKYSGMSIFLTANTGESGGISGVTKGTCTYHPDGEDINTRFTRYYIEAESTASVPQQMTSDILLGGPNLICDISNDRFGSTDVSLYLYLMP